MADIIAAGIIPAGLEMMDKITTGAVEPFVNAGYPLDAAAILLCESDGNDEEVAEEIERMKAVMQASGAIRSPRLAGRGRAADASGPGARPRSPPWAGCRPTTTAWTARSRESALARVLHGIAELEKKYGLRCTNVFHAGDGNLHPLILYDANQPGELETHRSSSAAKILELSIDVGGTITGEHGVGVEKINSMCVQFQSAGARNLPRRESRRSTNTRCSTRARPCRRCAAAPSSAACTCMPGRRSFPICRGSEP